MKSYSKIFSQSLIIFIILFSFNSLGKESNERECLKVALPGPCCEANEPDCKCPDCENDPEWRVYDLATYIRIIGEFERIINKNPPTLADFETLYPGAFLAELELSYEIDQCIKNGLELQSECVRFTNERAKNPDKVPSFFLITVQKLLKKDIKSSVHIYISPNIKDCCYNISLPAGGCSLLAKEVEGIIKINNRYKPITFILPCNYWTEWSFGKIIDFKIDGRWIRRGVWKGWTKSNKNE